METIKKMSRLLEEIQGDAAKFYEKGNKTAGTRVRLAMMEIKRLAQSVRDEISARKNAE